MSSSPTVQADNQSIESEVPQKEQGDDVESFLAKNKDKIRRKIKWGDKERELSLDELEREAQKGWASQGRFEQASQLRKATEDFLESLKKGDYQRLVKTIGKDAAKKLAEDLLIEELDRSTWSEDKIRAYELEKERDDYKSRVEEEENRRKEMNQKSLMAQARKEIDSEIAEVLNKWGKKPTPRIVARIAEQLLAHASTKDGRLTAKDAWNRVQSDMQYEISEFLNDLPKDKLLQVLPERLRKQLREAELDTFKSKDPFNRGAVGMKETDDVPRNKSVKKRMTIDQAFDEIAKKFGG